MTETEWLSCSSPFDMLEHLRNGPMCDKCWRLNHRECIKTDCGCWVCRLKSGGMRKLRLFLCASARLVWGLLNDMGKNAVEASERFADGLIDDQRLEEHRRKAYIEGYYTEQSQGVCAKSHAARMAMIASCGPRKEVRHAQENLMYFNLAMDVHRATQACILRDLFGNPFKPRREVAGQTPVALKIAEDIYSQRDWPLLPILADALEDSGCNQEDVLEHLRSPDPHYLGCWSLDLVLGKGDNSVHARMAN